MNRTERARKIRQQNAAMAKPKKEGSAMVTIYLPCSCNGKGPWKFGIGNKRILGNPIGRTPHNQLRSVQNQPLMYRCVVCGHERTK